MKITAALENDSGMFLMEELDLEDPREDEVLVKVIACGVCHTDVVMRGGNYLLGHETSGIVVKSGKKVRGFKPDDWVIVTYTHCGKCNACKDDRTYECNYIHHFFNGKRPDGTTPFSLNGKQVFPLMRQGGFSTFTVCHENALTKIVTNLDLKSLAPVGCGVMTGAGSVMNYLKPKKKKPLAVFGTGAVGLSAVLAAKVCGCDPIIAVDKNSARLNMASEFGATHCINTNKVENIETTIREICNGIDYGFDTSGNRMLLENLRLVLNKGGKACGVGIGGSINFSRKEYNEGKTWGSPDTGWSVPQKFIPRLLTLQKKGKFPFEKMIHFYPFDQINQAFKDAEEGRTIKPVLVME
ncbi:MAG: alcohol dehydrogenase catalytic domain-containing protein [Planctomycetaceae bacterium]|jgi:aryl-alcohol dehydrogenase|nr:alcohol dehydrogenase catalytic domain-containing protein [Planctomycetaceae bacterium]